MTTAPPLLTVANMRLTLDPQTFDTMRTREYWLQCGRAAMAALRLCCNLSPEEISYFRRDRWMPDGQAIIQVRDTSSVRDRDIPLIDAARVVVDRYIDATPAKFKGSRYLFVSASGGRLERTAIMNILNRAARRLKICHNFMESSGATFINAVYCDVEEDGAALVLTCRDLKGAGIVERPSLERLRACLERHHPLRDLNRIGFFETKTKRSKLVDQIRECVDIRKLGNAERQMLRRQFFADAIKLFDDGLVTQRAVGRFFGLDAGQIHKWFKRYRRKGRSSVIDRQRGRLTPEWRRKVVELQEKMSPIPSRLALHRALKKIHFPYGYTTLCNFLNDAGEKSPKKETMTRKWREIVDREYARFENPPQKKEFRLYLKKRFKFPYGRMTLEKYLNRTGLAPIKHGQIGGGRRRAVELGRPPQ